MPEWLSGDGWLLAMIRTECLHLRVTKLIHAVQSSILWSESLLLGELGQNVLRWKGPGDRHSTASPWNGASGSEECDYGARSHRSLLWRPPTRTQKQAGQFDSYPDIFVKTTIQWKLRRSQDVRIRVGPGSAVDGIEEISTGGKHACFKQEYSCYHTLGSLYQQGCPRRVTELSIMSSSTRK